MNSFNLMMLQLDYLELYQTTMIPSANSSNNVPAWDFGRTVSLFPSNACLSRQL